MVAPLLPAAALSLMPDLSQVDEGGEAKALEGKNDNIASFTGACRGAVRGHVRAHAAKRLRQP